MLISKFFGMLLIAMTAVAINPASAQVNVTAQAPTTDASLTAQFLPAGTYLVDTVPTSVSSPTGAGKSVFGHILTIVGDPGNNWEGSTYKFYGSKIACVASPGAVSQKISGNELLILVSWSKLPGCGGSELVVKKNGDHYTFESWKTTNGVREYLANNGVMKKK